jgi:prepilin peptidase CpaA
MHMPILVITIGLLLLVAYGDVRTRRISNTLNLTIGALGALRLVLAENPIDAALTLTAAAVVFAAGVLLFWRGVIGGGDAKLVSAMILLVGHHKALDFLVLMSLCGGALALAIMTRDVLARSWRSECGSRQTTEFGASGGSGESTVPYGVAVATAGVIILLVAK